MEETPAGAAAHAPAVGWQVLRQSGALSTVVNRLSSRARLLRTFSFVLGRSLSTVVRGDHRRNHGRGRAVAGAACGHRCRRQTRGPRGASAARAPRRARVCSSLYTEHSHYFSRFHHGFHNNFTQYGHNRIFNSVEVRSTSASWRARTDTKVETSPHVSM